MKKAKAKKSKKKAARKTKKKSVKKTVRKAKKKVLKKRVKKAVKKVRKKVVKKAVKKAIKKKTKPKAKKILKPIKAKKPAKIKTPYSKRELKSFRELLLNLKEDVLERIREMSEDTLMKSRKELSGDISGYSIHLADMASDNYERDFNLGLVSNERRLLLEIDEALKRIEEETYGICVLSGKPISKTRLKVIPYAKYCKNVQEKLEREGKL
ncbi:MAG: TraR/DksA C4-type zinc finger protein [Candidatus Omnitrophota bacterium]|nr:MAG: TraR/DksA C4-type zinc finger protein [Candidatus Omnitrophota bacterium]